MRECDRKQYFSSTIDKKEYVINNTFNCNNKCIIYLTYNKCKMQYVGKTIDDSRLQWNNYKDNNRKYLTKEACMQQHLLQQHATTVVFFMTFPLSLLIKLILKILTNENTTADIPLKQ